MEQVTYRLYDFTKSLLLRPGVAYSVAGKVNSADKLYLVIESVRLDTKHSLASMLLFLLRAREGRVSANHPRLVLHRAIPDAHHVRTRCAPLHSCVSISRPAAFLTTRPAMLRVFYIGTNSHFRDQLIPASSGDAFLIRLNATVGFYSGAGTGAGGEHDLILAVRSRYPFPPIRE